MDKRFFLKRKSEKKKHVFQFQQSNCHRSDKETLLRASVHSACLSTLFSKELQGVTGVMFILRPDLRWADLKATVDLRAKYICFINLWCWLSVLIYLECRSGWWSAGGRWHRDLRSAHVTLKQRQLFIGAERIKWHPWVKNRKQQPVRPSHVVVEMCRIWVNKSHFHCESWHQSNTKHIYDLIYVRRTQIREVFFFLQIYNKSFENT